ncbi:MAG: hypothetical protein ABSD11_17650, partial [Methylocella sp.]
PPACARNPGGARMGSCRDGVEASRRLRVALQKEEGATKRLTGWLVAFTIVLVLLTLVLVALTVILVWKP